VRFVIDGGRANKVKYDHTLRCPVLSESWVSHASTVQRKGRAGRTSRGICFYLYEQHFHENEMERYDKPNILEESVDRLVLFSMNLCGKSIEEMDLLDCPEASDVGSAKERLLDLGFLEVESGSLVLTADGKTACALSSTVRPESCRVMITCCRKYPQLVNKGLALAVLMSSEECIFSKNTSGPKDDHNRCNVRGDHMLSLQHFEWFAEANKKPEKGILKKKCAERGLNFEVLSAVQDDVDRCYRELKQRQLIPHRDTLDCSGVEFDCLGRAMASGYFSQVVCCIDVYSRGPAFQHVTINGVTLYLDRDSSLNEAIAPSHCHNSFIDDDSVDADRSMNGCCAVGTKELTSVTEVCIPNFMLYGTLKKSTKAGKIFMLDGSNIETRWVSDEAPSRWVDRVQFSSQQRSRMRLLIKHVGPKVLEELIQFPKYGTREGGNFFEELKSDCLVEAISTSREMRLIVVTGTQTSVNNAEDRIKQAIQCAKKSFCSADDSYNRSSRLQLGAGMMAKGRLQNGRSEERPFHQIFTAYGTNDRGYNKYSHAAHIVSVPKQRELIITPLHDCSMGMLRCAFNDVSKLGLRVTRDKDRFRVKPHDAQDTLDAQETLKHHKAFLCASLERQSFTQSKKQLLVMHALGREAYSRSAFWRGFRIEFLGGKTDSVLTFVRSHKSFLFGPGNDVMATAFQSNVAKLSTALQYHQIVHPVVFKPYEGRRFAAVLAETRKRFPKVFFHTCDVELCGGEVEENTEFQSDFEWLMSLVKSKKKVKQIRLCFASLHPKERAQARAHLNKHLSVEALQAAAASDPSSDSSLPTTRKFEQRQCVMCRRSIVVMLGKSAKVGANDLRGWNLTVCGCSYCRECFRHGVTETLQDELYKSARCANCKQIVLANDCYKMIVGPKDSPAKEGEGEWNQLCRLAEANYCKANETLITGGSRAGNANRRGLGWATCPDCDYSMVHPSGYRFFFCRNPKCRRKICTRCYTAPTSPCEIERCAGDKCSPRDGN
jgi:hypothetical protein